MDAEPVVREATVEDLWRLGRRAELIDGRIVPMDYGTWKTSHLAGRLRHILDAHQAEHGGGLSVDEGVAFIVETRRTQVLVPDAAWWTGAPPEGGVLRGAPAFAAIVRLPDQYGPANDRVMAGKRALYFAGGTRVVWDVQPRELQLRVHRADDPANPAVYRYHARDVAEAEPAVPGWRVPVNELFF